MLWINRSKVYNSRCILNNASNIKTKTTKKYNFKTLLVWVFNKTPSIHIANIWTSFTSQEIKPTNLQEHEVEGKIYLHISEKPYQISILKGYHIHMTWICNTCANYFNPFIAILSPHDPRNAVHNNWILIRERREMVQKGGDNVSWNINKVNKNKSRGG